MRLNEQCESRLARAARSFVQLKERFAEFISSLDYFDDPGCPVRDVAVDTVPGEHTCRISMATTTVEIRFLVWLPEDGKPAQGKVVASLISPMLGERPERLGEFTFDRDGATNFDANHAGERVNLVWSGPNIAMHFLVLGLERG